MQKTLLTFYVQVGRSTLGVADSVGHLAQVLARVVRAHRVDDQRVVLAHGDARVERLHLVYERPFPIPTHRHVPRHRLRLARELHLFALQLGLVRGRNLQVSGWEGRRERGV